MFVFLQDSAVKRICNGLLLGRIILSLKKPMFSTVNCLVLVTLFVLPLMIFVFGYVYSPVLRR